MSDAVVIPGNNIDVLKTFPDNSVDSVVTDPPYGLSFMGKKWDYDVPSKELWVEVLRVLKPGAYLLSFGGTRTYHRMVCAIEDAGFEIRDQVQWIYGSGFPKSMNVGKQVETHKGWGTALKPANEPIVLARKPLSESTVAKNVLKHGTGALNIDGTRIGMAEGEKNPSIARYKSTEQQGNNGWAHVNRGANFDADTEASMNQGRWPANVLFDEEAAAMLDEQSGALDPGGQSKKSRSQSTSSSQFGIGIGEFGEHKQYKDKGGASRFFYVAKASKRERNAGLEGMPDTLKLTQMRGANGTGDKNFEGGFQDSIQKNNHPTVKPLKLMEYLCKLITPPGGTILDPFCGSGSTGVAAVNLGFDFIGIELESDYCKIAEKRIENANDAKSYDNEEAG